MTLRNMPLPGILSLNISRMRLYDAGALFSLMSGSGSSVYGIFSKKPETIPQDLKDMIIWRKA